MTPNRRDHDGKLWDTGIAVARAARRIPGDASLAVLDCLMVAIAYTAAFGLRFEFDVPSGFWERFGYFLPAAVLVHLVANRLAGAYGHMWAHASFEEARRLVIAGLGSGALLLPPFLLIDRLRMPLSVLLVGPVLATVLMGAVRFQSRLFAFRRAKDHNTGLRVVVVGAGSGGSAMVREMRRNTHLGLRPVVVVDDDPRKHGRTLNGVRVVGSIDTLARVAREHGAHQIVLAIPSGDQSIAQRVAASAAEADLPVKVVPGVAELVQGRVSVRDARDLRIEDLLGRQQVEIDHGAVRALLQGRRVLVTGGGGSIGAEIARQAEAMGAAELTLLDHDETHLHDAAQGITTGARTVLADVRDRDVLDEVFAAHRPEVVFHAAAHKHVPILEEHPCEAVATNVLGTRNVVDAASARGVERVVAISTDKASRPSSVMGASKWLAEQIVLLGAPADRRFCSVRFGNVLGSRGSVIPTFQRQIASGGPVTVTDPRMTRFFMSNAEAVSLVLEAAAVSRAHEIFMLEMGQPVNILELAQRMIELCGYRVDTDIAIHVTGPRPGERLTEELAGPGEQLEPSPRPSILCVRPLRLRANELETVLANLTRIVERRDDEGARRELLDIARRVVPGEHEILVGDQRPAVMGVSLD